MKSLEDISSFYGAAAFRLWLTNNYYYQHNLKLCIDITNYKNNIKACLLDFEKDSHLKHDKFDGTEMTPDLLSSLEDRYLRIIIDEYFWNDFLNYSSEKLTSFTVSYYYRDKTCREDGSKLNQSVYEYIAWKAIPRQYFSAHKIKVGDQVFKAFENDMKKKADQRGLKVLKKLRENEFNRIKRRNNGGKYGAFIVKISMIDLCIDLGKSPSDIEFAKYTKRIINLIIDIDKKSEFEYFEHDELNEGLIYHGGEITKLSKNEIKTKITSMQKRSNLRTLTTEFYQKLLD